MFLVKIMREVQQSGQKVHYIDSCGFDPMAAAEACYLPPDCSTIREKTV